MSGHQSSRFRPEIDGLRAVAILLVAVFHFKLLPLGDAGFIGVDVFFVISGFLITRLLVRDLDAGRFSLKRFYVARFRRLMPALVATLILYFVAAWFIFLPDEFAELSREALLTQIYLVNFYFWQTINYFGLRADGVPLLHMWSLAVEEQFYLLYPIFLLLIARWARPVLLPLLVIGVLSSFLLGWWATGWKPVAAFYLLPTRAWELGAGAILALVCPRDLGARRWSAIAGVVGAGLILLALVLHGPDVAFPGWFAAMPVLGAVGLILAGQQSPTGRILSLAPMLWLGRISYPLYLVHWPVIQLTRNAAEAPAMWHGWAGFAVSLFVADAIQRWIEDPIRTGRALPGTKPLMLGLGSLSAVTIAFAAAGDLTRGMPSRFPAEAREVLQYTRDTAERWLWCEMSEHNDNTTPCPIGSDAGTVKATVIGDSHALALLGAFDLWFKETDIRAEHAFHHGCLPLKDVGGKACVEFMNTALKRLSDAEAPQTVFIASAWRHDPSIYSGRRADGADADRAMKTALDATVQALQDSGHSVVLVKPMHSAQASAPETLARNLIWGRETALNQPLADHRATFDVIHSAFNEAALEDGVETISLIDDLCVDDVCRAVLDGKPVFTDGSHVRYGLSDYFARQLETAMAGKAN